MAGLDNMNINLSLKDREGLFKFLDVSHDGSLSYREFCNLWVSKNQKIKNSQSAEQISNQFDYEQISQMTSNVYHGVNPSPNIKRK
jgi:hypothetical protein